MPFDPAKYGIAPEDSGAPRKFNPAKYGIDAAPSRTSLETAPGASPDNPVQEQHPDIPFWRRALIMNFTQTSDQAKRYLERQGFEVVDRGNWNLSVRKKGEQQWRVLDPEGFDVQDISDVGSDVAIGTTAGTVGTIAGAAATPVSSPAGGLAAGIATAGATTGALEGVKAAAGKALGLDPSLGDVGTGMAREAAWGAAGQAGGELLGAGIRKIGGALQYPAKLEAAASGDFMRQAMLDKAQKAQLAINQVQEGLRISKTGTKEKIRGLGQQLRETEAPLAGAAMEALPADAALSRATAAQKAFTAETALQPPAWQQTADELAARKSELGDINLERSQFGKEAGYVQKDLGHALKGAVRERGGAIVEAQGAITAEKEALHNLRTYLTEMAEGSLERSKAALGGASGDQILKMGIKAGDEAAEIATEAAKLNIPAKEFLERQPSIWKAFQELDDDGKMILPTSIPTVVFDTLPEALAAIDKNYGTGFLAQRGLQSASQRMREVKLSGKLLKNGEQWFRGATRGFESDMSRLLLSSDAAKEFLDNTTRSALNAVYKGTASPTDFRRVNELIVNIAVRGANDPVAGELKLAWMQARDVADAARLKIQRAREAEAPSVFKLQGKKESEAMGWEEIIRDLEKKGFEKKSAVRALSKKLEEMKKVKNPRMEEIRQTLLNASAQKSAKTAAIKGVKEEVLPKAAAIKNQIKEAQDDLLVAEIKAARAKEPLIAEREAAKAGKMPYGRRRYTYAGRHIVETALNTIAGAGGVLKWLAGEPAPEAIKRVYGWAKLESPRLAKAMDRVGWVRAKISDPRVRNSVYQLLAKNPALRSLGPGG